MTIKHTPGPWSVEGDEFGLLIRMEQLAGKDEYLAIYASPNPEQRLADAHLMALAPTAPHECDDPECPGNKNRRKLEVYPDLLEACRMALEHIVELAEAWQRGSLHEIDGKGGTRSNRNMDIIAQFRAAIAKAERREAK